METRRAKPVRLSTYGPETPLPTRGAFPPLALAANADHFEPP